MDISPITIICLPVVLFAIICHEIGHAYIAYRGGDDTARLQGRISFNPIVHMDPIGTIVVPLLLVISGLPPFGWAKPVPVNPANLRSKQWNLAVSLAGVTINLALAVIAAILYKIFLLFGLDARRSPGFQDLNAYDITIITLNVTIFINLLLMTFNLIPIPPLDVSHVFLHFITMRDSLMFKVYQFLEQFGFMLLLLLIISGALGYILWPVINIFKIVLSFLLGIPNGMFIF